MKCLHLLPILLLAASPALARSPSNRLSEQLNSITPSSLNHQRGPQTSSEAKAASNQGLSPTGPQTLPVIPYRGG